MIQLVQGSKEWHAWRLSGVGASEVPSLMGESEFQTPRDIWKVKVGLVQEVKESNFAMQRGTEAEPRIRALYELYNDRDMTPVLVQHPILPFFIASLDGWNADIRRVLEIKYPGKDKHDQAKEKIIPSCYYGQVQAQMFAALAVDADYVSFNGESIAVVNVAPDTQYIDRMVKVVIKFWKEYVETKIPPPLTDRDYKEEASKELRLLFDRFKSAKLGCKPEKVITELKKEIIPMLDHPRYRCEGVKVVRNIKGVHTFSLEGN